MEDKSKIVFAVVGIAVAAFVLFTGNKKSAVDISGFIEAQAATNKLFLDSATEKVKLQSLEFQNYVDIMQAASVFDYNQKQANAIELANVGEYTGRLVDNYFYNRDAKSEQAFQLKLADKNALLLAQEREFQLAQVAQEREFQLALAKRQSGGKIANILNGAGSALGGAANLVSSIYGFGSLFKASNVEADGKNSNNESKSDKKNDGKK